MRVRCGIFLQNGFVSGLPYLCMFLTSITFGWLSNWLISRNMLTVSMTKKTMQTIGQMVPAIGLVWLSFVGCDRTMAAVALCLSVGGNGAIYSGYIVSFQYITVCSNNCAGS